MTLEKLRELRKEFDVGDIVALVECTKAFGKEQNEYYALYYIAKSAKALNHVIADMETNDLPWNDELNDSYRTLVRHLMEGIERRIEAHENHELNFLFFEKEREFRCRRCGHTVGWLHPDLQDRYMFSSSAEGDEAEGICYECWAKYHPEED